ncbi:muconate cycloisomerase CatB (plasmid) [Cupriavidus necator N-1]|uniref:Muconate cycloisomerase CatB n=1 Tax=Cupriavidus necator (strain ATCC 43291 / DSM 13513 / CCUG 52238 / LMG 8453 / N-1) TaxID=1042878 RepID=F8GVM3_CUPNN|nr:muconate cycloisomerase CatB [Cupriavidus necator N-1]
MIAAAPAIERVETLLGDIPTIRHHKLSVATMNCQTPVFVRVRCRHGIEGVGVGTTIGGLAYGEESPESIQVSIDTYFAALPLGMDATRNGAAMAHVRKLFQDNRFAKCALVTKISSYICPRLLALASHSTGLASTG